MANLIPWEEDKLVDPKDKCKGTFGWEGEDYNA